MRRLAFLMLLTLLASPFVRPAFAQERVEPAPGALAIGGDVGFFVPRGPFDVTAAFDGFAEFYVHSRVSVRAMFAFTQPGYDTGTGTVRRASTTLDVLYNWESGLWHPFVAGGVGVHALQPNPTGVSFDAMRTRVGAGIGAGIEYFARPKISVKFEAMYRYVRTGGLGFDPSGLSLTAGLKRYF